MTMKKKNKRKLFVSFFGIGIFLLSACESKLPNPEVISGYLGTFGVDKNINMTTIDKYLNRSDTVYRDMRMLVDPADFSAIGGDSYLSGYIEGFSVVPYPFLAPIELPEAVGVGYQGPTLFTLDNDGHYIAAYTESLDIIHTLFPQDKNIFVMCGGGGYAMMTKTLLLDLGYNAQRIWHVGCYWEYTGDHAIQVKETDDAGDTYYAFWQVDYKVIDFDYLTPVSSNA